MMLPEPHEANARPKNAELAVKNRDDPSRSTVWKLHAKALSPRLCGQGVRSCSGIGAFGSRLVAGILIPVTDGDGVCACLPSPHAWVPMQSAGAGCVAFRYAGRLRDFRESYP